jgi:hypothetical protein
MGLNIGGVVVLLYGSRAAIARTIKILRAHGYTDPNRQNASEQVQTEALPPGRTAHPYRQMLCSDEFASGYSFLWLNCGKIPLFITPDTVL